jgi:thiazole synthase ThiGH ThiG subunit
MAFHLSIVNRAVEYARDPENAARPIKTVIACGREDRKSKRYQGFGTMLHRHILA